MILSWYGYR